VLAVGVWEGGGGLTGVVRWILKELRDTSPLRSSTVRDSRRRVDTGGRVWVDHSKCVHFNTGARATRRPSPHQRGTQVAVHLSAGGRRARVCVCVCGAEIM
jgi:hypothetical protein